jgi:hypothetical protein
MPALPQQITLCVTLLSITAQKASIVAAICSIFAANGPVGPPPTFRPHDTTELSAFTATKEYMVEKIFTTPLKL